MTLAPELIIDADSHITEPRDVWTARVPAKYRDRVPHVVREGPKDLWVLDDKPLTPVGVTAPAGWPTFPPEYPPTYADVHPGSYDADARLRYMDGAGIWAQVLYPNVGGFGSQNFLTMDDEELKLLCVTAYNDFLLDWASADLRRILLRKGEPADRVSLAIERLERAGFVDDASFARQFTRSKGVGGGLSKRRVQQELSKRGVARDISDEAIETVFLEEGVDEEASIEKVARKKLRSLSTVDEATRRRRLYSFLARRGYDSDAIGRVLRAVLAPTDDDTEPD